LSGISDLEVCRQVRAVSSMPIIVLSVKDRERDKVEALDQGADDYVANPYNMDEVLARVRVALRRLARVGGEAESVFCSGSLTVDFIRHRVLVAEQEVALTPTEFNLLKILIAHRGRLLTRQMLASRLWGEQQERERRHSLHVYVARLRQKIEPAPAPYLHYPRYRLSLDRSARSADTRGR
jgi:two-component system KDP operon response regulator KdpE